MRRSQSALAQNKQTFKEQLPHERKYIDLLGNSKFVAPIKTKLIQVSIFMQSTVYGVQKWAEFQQDRKQLEARDQIRHILRIKADWKALLPGLIYTSFPFMQRSFPAVLRHFPHIVPAAFISDDILRLQLQAADADAVATSKAIRDTLVSHLSQQSVSGIEKEMHSRLLLMLSAKQPQWHDGDLIDLYGFCHERLSLSQLPQSKAFLARLAQLVHLTLPSFNPLAKLYRWSDWIIKDTTLIASQGIHNLAEYELYEALYERGVTQIESLDLAELQLALDRHVKFTTMLTQAACRYRKRINASSNTETVALTGLKVLGGVSLTPSDVCAIATLLLLRPVLTDLNCHS